MVLNSLIESGLIHACIASIGGCSINYAIAIKKNKKPKMICYLIDVTISVFIAYYAFWAMEDLMNFQMKKQEEISLESMEIPCVSGAIF